MSVNDTSPSSMSNVVLSAVLNAAIQGLLDIDTVEGFNRVLTTGSLFSTEDSFSVLDVRGAPLIKGGIYLYLGERVRIEGWQFGSGNMMDTYYHLWYIKARTLEKRKMVVGVSYPNGITGIRIYRVDMESLEMNNE